MPRRKNTPEPAPAETPVDELDDVDVPDPGEELHYTTRVCALGDCRRPATRRGLCDAHYDTHRGLADKDTADE